MPTKPQAHVLIVDDDPIVAESLAALLGDAGYRTATAGNATEAIDLLDAAKAKAEGFGIVVTDVHMPRGGGFDLLRSLREHHPDAVPIVVTGFGKIEDAVEAVKLGAADYLTKPVIDDELRLAVSKAEHQHALLAENQTLKKELTDRYGMGSLVGADYRMQRVYDLIEAVAESPTTVLITGESGTGKSMVARAIHTASDRQAEPFITFACGSIPETLLESELFGHVKGAFTGADHDKPGKLLAANGGTLFIDEINSATPALQLKLLRVLQEKAFEPVGATATTRVDVRFVLATNQALEPMVEEGTFREDLYYRINVVNIQLPSLADRPGDVALLAEHFLAKYAAELRRDRTLGDAAMDALRAHDWPGNVRELENAIQRGVLLSKSNTIEPGDLPEAIAAGGSGTGGVSPLGRVKGGAIVVPALADGWTPTPLAEAMQEPERQILLAALRANDWNRNRTADQLNINRTTLYKKIKQYHLDELDAA
ncbi:MAG: sigma-54 dependent transcriptional regulator [Planctomycetota bacterium]